MQLPSSLSPSQPFCVVVAHPKMLSSHPRDGQGVAAWSLPSQKIIYRILQPSHLQVTAPVANTGGRGQSLPCLLLQETPPEAQQHLLSVVASSERQRGGRGGGELFLFGYLQALQ